MAGGLFALLDDVALIAKKAAASAGDVAHAAASTSTKAAAVVVDDTAVAPDFVRGVTPARELPIVWQITKGSLVNKIVIILPVALLLSWLAPWALTPILMVGGTYLSFEGAEKLWHAVAARRGDGHHGGTDHAESAVEKGPDDEKSLVKGAVATDLILSAEIMVLSLNEVTDEPFLERAVVLVVVAFVITFAVYGVVGLLVKTDDVGLALAASGRSGATRKLGGLLVDAMPKILSTLSVVGTAAMLWVGGHILVTGVDELGWHVPHEIVHHLQETVGGGDAVAWIVETACSAVVGVILGTVVLAVVTAVGRLRR
jgi:predicted DNA repair protein MutK